MKRIIANIFKLKRFVKRYFYIYWNLLKFYLKNVKFGNNLRVYSQMYLDVNSNSSISIGNNFTFTSNDCINPLCRNIRGCIVTYADAHIVIGNNVGVSSSCIWAQKSITIGNNVNIGGDCIIMDSDAHSLNFMDRHNPIYDKANKIDEPIIIEDDVLIGTRCIILKGVTIGARSVIGSGSIVTKSIPNDCIAAGNPCKVIRYM